MGVTTGQIVVLGVVALLGFWAVGAYNRLVRLRGATVSAWAPIDAQLRRRQALTFELAELLAEQPTLRDGVGRATLETLMAATRQAQAAADHAQSRPSRAGAIQSLGLAEQVLEGAMRPLRVLLDARPQWSADHDTGPRVRSLLNEVQEVDSQLLFARRGFNDAVRAFNGAVHEMPTCLLASAFGFKPAATLQTATPDRGPDSQVASAFGERA